MTDETVILVAGTREVGDWSGGITVSRGINQVPAALSLSFPRGIVESDGFDLNPFDAVTLTANDDVLLAGKIDDVSDSEDAQSADFSVNIRGDAAVLVDSSVHDVPEEGWKNTPLSAIAGAIAAPFGIVPEFRHCNASARIPKFRINQGEKAHAAIARLCAMRGLLAGDAPGQPLIIAGIGRERAGGALRSGENVIDFKARRRGAQRFGRYLGRAQSAGTDDRKAVRLSAIVRDSGAPNDRVLVINVPGDMDEERLRHRVMLEAQLRKAGALAIDVIVDGWREGGGQTGAFWTPNRLVETQLSGPLGDIDAELLVYGCAYSQDLQGDGTRTTLTMVPPMAAATAASALALDTGIYFAGVE